jgi:ribosomal protein L40E
MPEAKICSRCGGAVDVSIAQHRRPDRTFVSYAEGVCRSCGATYEESELLALKGPGPVGG